MEWHTTIPGRARARCVVSEARWRTTSSGEARLLIELEDMDTGETFLVESFGFTRHPKDRTRNLIEGFGLRWTTPEEMRWRIRPEDLVGRMAIVEAEEFSLLNEAGQTVSGRRIVPGGVRPIAAEGAGKSRPSIRRKERR